VGVTNIRHYTFSRICWEKKLVQSVKFSIFCALFAGLSFSVNDIAIKYFTELMPLHEVVLFRAVIALIFTLAVFLPFEGGWKALRTRRPLLHIIGGFCVVLANLCFFSALASIPLANDSAIFFVAPLIITALSALILKESVGFQRWSALVVGMIGVLLIIKPGSINFEWAILLPLVAALAYSLKNIIARNMGLSEAAVTMSFYLHITFIASCAIMGILFGDGKLAVGDDPALQFIFRAWVIPSGEMMIIIFVAGISSALGGYYISQAYRHSSASLVAPFEYSTLPLAVFWGYFIWEEFPDLFSGVGIILIMASGIFVALREGKREGEPSAKRVSGRR